METITLQNNVGAAAIKAASVLRSGGVILYPTDTLYGLGADALSDVAVDRIFAIKDRDPLKPISCVVADLDMARSIAHVDEIAERLAKAFLPGPLTLVLPKKKSIHTGIGRGVDTIAIRIPNNDFCLELARTFGFPFTTTSANRAGVMPALSAQEIMVQLGDSADAIDLVIDAGWIPEAEASTVVSCVSGTPNVLREGVVSTQQIQQALQ